MTIFSNTKEVPFHWKPFVHNIGRADHHIFRFLHSQPRVHLAAVLFLPARIHMCHNSA